MTFVTLLLKCSEPTLDMEKAAKVNAPCPFNTASNLSRLCFAWLLPLFVAGNRKDLELEDLHQVPSNDEPHLVAEVFEKSWRAELRRSKSPSVLRAIFRTWGWGWFLYSQLNTFAVSDLELVT